MRVNWLSTLAILVGSLLASARTVYADIPDAGAHSESLLQQGRDLMRRGELMAAKDQFEAVFLSTGDAEAVFLVAECWEKAAKDGEARTYYRKYLQLPFALRAAEATSRIQAIEKRKGKAPNTTEPGKPPRHVLVPLDKDRGACAERCTAADACPRPERKQSRRIELDECLATQFSCLRTCDGATVGAGACPELSPQQHLRCFPDKRPTVGAGWLTPGHF